MSNVYTGKDAYTLRDRPTAIATHSIQIVLDLAEQYLKSGRTVTTNNYYTSVALAKLLQENQTHLIGTLWKNRAGNPKAVVDAHLQKDEVVGRENEDGIIAAKWRSVKCYCFQPNMISKWLIQEEKMEIMKKS